MINTEDLALNYITNKSGEKTAVILPIEQFEELLEDIEDLAIRQSLALRDRSRKAR